jgi:hypothetical protein
VTPNEFLMLVCGIGIGAECMAVTNMVWDMRDARRGRTESEAALKRAAGDHYLNTFRLYRLQHRTGARS